MVMRIAVLALAMSVMLAGQTTRPGAPPEATITNGLVTARLYLPDRASGFYRGTRFDWSGVVGHLEYAGHTYYAQWFTASDETTRDFTDTGTAIIAGPNSAITGPSEEYSTDGKGLGYDDAPAGGTFIKIGVGVLRKPADGGTYSQFRLYEIVDGGQWTVRPSSDAVAFTHVLSDASSGYGYEYRKTVRLERGQPELVIEHTLVNRGTRPLTTSVYNHNFLTLDGQTTGADFSIEAPYAITTTRPPNPALASVQDRKVVYARPLGPREVASTPLLGFGPTAADYHFRIENAHAGAGVEIAGDRPLSNASLWSIRTVIAIEPFVTMTVAPGESVSWGVRYRYYLTRT